MTRNVRSPTRVRSPIDVTGYVQSIEPRLSGVAAALRVEFVDAEPLLIGVGRERAFEHRVQRPARCSSPPCLRSLCFAEDSACRRRGTGSAATSRLAARRGDREPGRARLVCRRNGPNSSPNQSVPSRATRTDSMSKSPPVNNRLRRMVCVYRNRAPGVCSAIGDDRKVDSTIRVVKRDECFQVDCARSACLRLEVWIDAVDTQQEVRRVLLRAEPIVRHHPERPIPSGQYG